MSESASLAIIGISCLFPKADDLQAYWRNIKSGVDAITPVPASHWSIADYFNGDSKAPDQTYAQRGGFISPVDFNPMEFGIAPKDVEAIDTTQLLGMVAAKQALVDAGYGEKPFKKETTSVILGVTGALEMVIPLGARLGHPIWRRALKEAGVDDSVSEDVVQRISDSYVGWQENSFPGLLGNVAAGRIANRLDLGGTNCVVDAACASSMAALHLAAMELATGRSDMVITGGIDTFNDIFMYMCFSKTPALSPSGDAKPFDSSCDGTILGEGLGMLVIKRLADAERDGDRVYAVITGIGSSSDGRGNAIYAPRAEGQMEALRRAYEEANVTPEMIDLVEAHGTGTKVGDATELHSLTEVFRGTKKDGTWAALGSVKSQIGHAKAAAGVAGIIKVALALDRKVLPPTIKVTQPTPELASGDSPFYVNTQKSPWLPRADRPRRAGVSAFGFGGTNFHCVLEEHGARMEKPGWDGDVEIIALSSDSREDLRKQVSSLPVSSSWTETRNRAWQSRKDFRSDAAYRLLLPVSAGADMASLRDGAAKMLDAHPDKASWVLPTGAALGSGAKRGKLAALFPGQGSQYVGMFRDLACQFPEMIDALTEANRIFTAEHPELGEQRLSDFIYPHPIFNDAARAKQGEALKSTDIAQPALGAIGLGGMNVLGYFGVTPEAAAGHSYGELLALCGAGRLQPESLHLLSNVRGRLMASKNGSGDRGSMLAVQASEEVVTRYVGQENSQLVIANRNSPNQFVLAGPTAQIELAAAEFAKQSIRARVLPVSAAFHSSLVADAREPFAAALENVAIGRGRMAVYANSTAKPYPAGAKQARELLAGQIVKPVDFIAQIEAMHADGVTTFVEMGPGHVLSDLVQAILKDRGVETIALDASKGSRSGIFDLAVALCRVAALGHPVDLTRWEECPPAPKTDGNGKLNLKIQISGANYRSPQTPRPAKAAASVKAAANRISTEAGKGRDLSLLTSAATPKNGPLMSGALPKTNLEPNMAAALQLAQQGILSLQKLQEQTAQLHRQFLEGQDAARRTLESLLAQRRELLHLPAIGLQQAPIVPMPAVMSVPTPAPVVAQPVSKPATDTPPAVVSAPVAKASTASAVVSAVLGVVSEKTGYPAEMLNLDMGLDSDLGIDSIKRVEIMAALRGRLPLAPEIKPEHLGTLQTLRQVAEFLSSGQAEVVSVTVASSPAPAVATSSVGYARASEALLKVVSDKTGYPVEMLNLDMGLDSDLGVDSIKRVEIMAAIRGQLPDAPEIKPEHLGTLQTLKQVVEFLTGGQEAQTASPTVIVSEAPGRAAVGASRAAEVVLQVVSDKTGYPVEMLNLDMGLDSDLGVDSIKRVEIMAAIRGQLPDAPEIKPEHLGSLQTLKQVVEYLAGAGGEEQGAGKAQEMKPVVAAPMPVIARAIPVLTDDLHRQLVKPVRFADLDRRATITLPPHARIWVTEDGSELSCAVESRLQGLGYSVRRGSPAELISAAQDDQPAALVILWPAKRADDALINEMFRLIQVTGPSLRRNGNGQGGILVTASRLDGVFGFGSLNGNGDPISGGLAGLLKTAHHEWPEVNCKAIDMNPEVEIGPAVADLIVEEMFREGPIEVGISGTTRFGLQVETVPQENNGAIAVLNSGDVVVVTGGARGITATTALELARKHCPQLVLLGRSKLVETEPEWLAGYTTEAEIKKALLAHGNGYRSPKQVEAGCREVLAQREIRDCLRQIHAIGAKAVYRAVDVRNTAEVKKIFAEIRQDMGPIRGLIHGAGVLADRRIEDKTEEQFALVYSTKVAGLKNLLHATATDELKVLALFSSYTGRFGRTGQADYAAANEVLNKIAQSESRRRPKCRVVSFNWGPWNGGMVSDGLRKIFESEGVGLIEPSAGADFFVREISSHVDRPVEVLALAHSRNGNRAVETIAEDSDGSNVAFERVVSIKTVPCLESHVLNGRAVLPTALMIEWLGHGAVHGNPGMAFHGFENFKVLKGLVLEPQGSVTVSVIAEPVVMRDGLLWAPVRLVSRSGQRTVLHACAVVSLAEVLPLAPPNGVAMKVHTNGNGHHIIYGNGHLFHGHHFQGIEALESCSEVGISALVKSAPLPKSWLQDPLRPAWLSDPLALDCSFQMMILWSWEHRNAASLPCAIRRFRQFASTFPKSGTRVVIDVESNGSPMVMANLHFYDRQGKLLALAEGYECVVDQGLQDAFRQNLLRHEG